MPAMPAKTEAAPCRVQLLLFLLLLLLKLQNAYRLVSFNPAFFLSFFLSFFCFFFFFFFYLLSKFSPTKKIKKTNKRKKLHHSRSPHPTKIKNNPCALKRHF
jgi:hypothetical protein